jgi:hypothetical protein
VAAQDTLTKIAELFGQLGTGVVDPQLQRVIWQQLSEDFAQLALDLATDPGWVAMSGSGTRGGFNTATVSTAQLAQVVKAMLDAGMGTGEYGP